MLLELRKCAASVTFFALTTSSLSGTATLRKELPCALALVEEAAEGNGKSLPDLAKRVLNVSKKTSENLLSDPKYGPLYRRILTVTAWVSSKEAQRVNTRAAALIEAKELALTHSLARFYESKIDLLKIMEIIFKDKEVEVDLTPASDNAPTQQQMGALFARVDEYHKAEYEKYLRGIDVVQLFQQAAQEAREGVADSEYRSEFAEILMSTYYLLGIETVNPRGLWALMNLFTSGPQLKASIQRATETAVRAIGGIPTFQRLLKDTDAAFKRAGYTPRKVNHVGLVTFSGQLRKEVYSERIFSRFLTRDEIEAELDGIFREYLTPVGLSAQRHAQCVTYLKAYFYAQFEGYVPTKRTRTNAEILHEHQKQLLKSLVQTIIQSYDKDTQAKTREIRPPEMKVVFTTLTREERINRYLAAKEEAVQARLEEVVLSGTGSVANVSETVANEVPSEAEIAWEELIAINSIGTSAAEALLTFFDEVSVPQREALEAAIRELLHPDNRRMQLQSEGAIKYLPIYKIYELRAAGKPRVYFGLSPLEGPVLILGHLKKDDSEQKQKLVHAAGLWKKYLNPISN